MSQKPYILVIDDDVDIQTAFIEFLSDEGYESHVSNNGAEALNWMRSGASLPQLILLDLMMPVCDGYEFRRQQLADASLAAIPVVLISADGNLAEKAKKMKIDEILQKPVSLKNLFEVVQNYF